MVLTERTFSKRLAFAYLEDLQNEFLSQYGSKIDHVSRPYSFIEFGKGISPLKITDGRFASVISFLFVRV